MLTYKLLFNRPFLESLGIWLGPPKDKLWGYLEQVLQAKCFSCRPTSSIKSLNGKCTRQLPSIEVGPTALKHNLTFDFNLWPWPSNHSLAKVMACELAHNQGQRSVGSEVRAVRNWQMNDATDCITFRANAVDKIVRSHTTIITMCSCFAMDRCARTWENGLWRTTRWRTGRSRWTTSRKVLRTSSGSVQSTRLDKVRRRPHPLPPNMVSWLLA